MLSMLLLWLSLAAALQALEKKFVQVEEKYEQKELEASEQLKRAGCALEVANQQKEFHFEQAQMYYNAGLEADIRVQALSGKIQ